jgi:Arc/MetJ-type ribon-helix-helix transcriptional regulator
LEVLAITLRIGADDGSAQLPLAPPPPNLPPPLSNTSVVLEAPEPDDDGSEIDTPPPLKSKLPSQSRSEFVRDAERDVAQPETDQSEEDRVCGADGDRVAPGHAREVHRVEQPRRHHPRADRQSEDDEHVDAKEEAALQRLLDPLLRRQGRIGRDGDHAVGRDDEGCFLTAARHDEKARTED